ncbi:MAG: electron transfer flavoprotein subunit alpha/FixB family protein [Actinomycetota bacterium]
MILVLVESGAQGATLVSLEALTFARDMAARLGDTQVHAVVTAPLEPDGHERLLAQLSEQGVATLHHAQDDRLARYAAAAWAAAVVDAAFASSARVIVAAGSPRGNEVLAHVATRLDAMMAANVTAIDSTEPLVVSRQVMGGAALEETRLDGEVVVLSVAGHATAPEPAPAPVSVQVLPIRPSLTDADLQARVTRSQPTQADAAAALANARVVVGAGRGTGGPDRFGDILELVGLLDGALGVSRVVTSLGWRPHHEQVGQTGSRISPDIYIACGISGAIQHWAGCQSARTILAINTDPDAPMVTKADYAVIGDLHEVVPAINAELRKRRS